MKVKKVSILDVTIRDGSYAMNFQYTAEHVKEIISKLQSAGVEWAEIGHGIGFGSGKAGLPCLTPDEEQIAAAAEVAATTKRPIKIGVIGGPPVLKIDELKNVADKLQFARLACNVITPEYLKEVIPACRKLGLKVFVQMMRSSAVLPKEAAASARKLAEYGAEVIYIVDTAGSFIPAGVSEYVKHVQDACKTDVGFHAHNNLMLAMANTLEAIKANASFIDASLRGIGRGSGNVPLEMLVLVLKTLKIPCNIDERAILTAADEIYEKLYQYLPRPDSSDAYAASRRRDFFPHYLLEVIAKEMGITVFDIIDDMTKLPGGTELTIDDIGDIITKRGRDENEVFKKIGLIPSV